MSTQRPRRSMVFAAVLCAVAVVVASVPQALAEGGGGKEAFLTQKCNTCHAVSSAGIEAKTASEKMKGPDLTGVSARHEPSWMLGYVKREVELEGQLHKKPFKGSDEELQAIVDWLLEQKSG